MMKKEYKKPVLIAESFAMTEHIAACAEDAFPLAVGFHHKENGCGISVFGGMKVMFLEGTNSKCDFFESLDVVEDYHGYEIFASDLFGS